MCSTLIGHSHAVNLRQIRFALQRVLKSNTLLLAADDRTKPATHLIPTGVPNYLFDRFTELDQITPWLL